MLHNTVPRYTAVTQETHHNPNSYKSKYCLHHQKEQQRVRKKKAEYITYKSSVAESKTVLSASLSYSTWNIFAFTPPNGKIPKPVDSRFHGQTPRSQV